MCAKFCNIIRLSSDFQGGWRVSKVNFRNNMWNVSADPSNCWNICGMWLAPLTVGKTCGTFLVCLIAGQHGGHGNPLMAKCD